MTKRQNATPTSTAGAALLALALTSPRAFGLVPASEIAQPAGALPTEPVSEGDDAPLPKNKKAKKPAPPKPTDDKAEAQRPTEVWESYTDNTASVAHDISHGIRVEDIVEPPSDYRYAAFGKPDPFVPPMVTSEELGASAASAMEIPIVSPLQRYALSELSVTGIWQGPSGEMKAMVMVPANAAAATSSGGQGIIVKNGDPIGNRGGKILGIGDGFVTVREFMLAPDGTRQYEDQQLHMGKRNPDEIPGKIRFTPGVKKTEVLLEDEGGKPVQDSLPYFRKARGTFPGALPALPMGGETPSYGTIQKDGVGSMPPALREIYGPKSEAGASAAAAALKGSAEPVKASAFKAPPAAAPAPEPAKPSITVNIPGLTGAASPDQAASAGGPAKP